MQFEVTDIVFNYCVTIKEKEHDENIPFISQLFK